MPSAAAQDVLQAILEQRAAEKRREMAAPPAGPPAALPFSSRIAGAFEAAQPVRQVDELSAPITLPFAARNQLGDWHGRMPNVVKALTDPRTSPFGPAAVARLFMDPAGEVGRQVETGEQLAEPFTQFNDPNVDPVKQGADLALTVMGGSSVVPAEANSLRAGLTWKHPISANKLRRPLEEMTATYAPGARQLPMKEFNFEDVPEGSHFVALFGDRTMGGKRLTGVNEMSFDNPVDLQAGSDFLRRQRNPEDAFWASDKGPITGYENRIRPLQETGKPVYGVTAAMASKAGDYSAQTTKTLLEMIKQQPLSKKARKAIDDAMRAPWGKKIPAYPDWPGVDNITDEYLQGAGSARTKFAQLLDSKRIADMGGPDVGSARKAVTHPELLDAPFLGTGHRIFRLDEPVQHLTDPKVPHFDYASQLASPGGEFVGGVKPIPGVRFWVDWAKRQKPGLDEAKLGRSFMTQSVTQRHSQQWLDNLMKYTQSENGRKLGIAGAIGAGLLTSGEAMEMFGTDGAAEKT